MSYAPRRNNAKRQSAKYRSGTAKDKSTRLEYAAIAVAGLAFIASAFAAGFSGWQAWVASDTEVVTNRAIVISDQIKLIAYDSPVEGAVDPKAVISGPRTWVVGAIIKNVGNTQTRRLKFHGGTGFGVASDAEFNKLIAETHFARAFLGPHSEFFTSQSRFTNAIIKAPVAAMGFVWYLDIFKYRHYSEFCFNVRLPPIDFYKYPAGQAIYLPADLPCEHHNCTDDDCGSDWQKRALNWK